MRASSDLGLLVPEIHLFHSRKKCVRYLGEHSDGEPLGLGDTDGQMFYQDGVVVVLIEHDGRSETEQSLLVHEAYHAAVAHMTWLGEDAPGEEVMAYLIQTISHALFVAHSRWKRKHNLLES